MSTTITFADLVNKQQPKKAASPISARAVNWFGVKSATISAAITAASDGFSEEYDSELVTLRQIAQAQKVERDKERIARINAALKKAGVDARVTAE